MPPVDQTTLKVEIIKQNPGAQTAARRVKANIPSASSSRNSNPQSKKHSTMARQSNSGSDTVSQSMRKGRARHITAQGSASSA